jgi:predicted permease
MPTAVSLVVIGSLTGSDNRFISSSIFYTHVVSLFTIPVWLVIYNTLF